MPKRKESTVIFELDRAKPPKLTARQRAQLAALSKLPDKDIDYRDIPPVPDSFWAGAVRGGLLRPVKQQLTIRIDGDVLAWLKSKGAGHHGRLNQVLRSAMLSEIEGPRKTR